MVGPGEDSLMRAENLPEPSRWMQIAHQAPEGALVRRKQDHTVLCLPRAPKEGHWTFWFIIVAMTVLGTEPVPGAGFNWVGAGFGFTFSVLLYWFWWRSRTRVLLFDDRLVIRRGVGLLSSRTELQYDGLELDRDGDELSLYRFEAHDGDYTTLPASPWLASLLDAVLDERGAKPSSSPEV